MATAQVGYEVTPQIDIKKLTDATVLLSMSFFLGIGRMRQVDIEVTSTADASLIRHQKQLLTSPELDAIRNSDSELKRWVDLKTCVYGEGIVFLPTALFDTVNDRLEEYASLTRPALVDAFIETYDQRVNEARSSLGDLFNDSDYPSRETVRMGFQFTFRYLSIEVSGKIATLDSTAFQKQQQKAEALMLKAAQEVRVAMRATAAGLVEKLADVLKPNPDGTRKKLYDSHIEKLNDYLATFNFRNITNDAELQQHIETLRSITAGVTTNKLRESTSLKIQLASRLDAIKGSLHTLVEDVPMRRFR